MNGRPSADAYEAHYARLRGVANPSSEEAGNALDAAHSDLGLDRSVCLRDVVETLRCGRYENDTSGAWWAGFIEREFGEAA